MTLQQRKLCANSLKVVKAISTSNFGNKEINGYKIHTGSSKWNNKKKGAF